MKRLLASLLLVLTGLLARPAIGSGADMASTAAGHWAGDISLPQQPLPIAVELASTDGATWEGSIDIPLQGVRGFKLGAVKIDGAAVEFAMPGVPGDPYFRGKLAPDGKTIAGDFSQGVNTLPFRLERTAKPAPRPVQAPVPDRGVPGKGLAGKWLGSIKPIPAMELRLGLELASDSAGKIGGVVVSLDQGNGRIAVEDLTDVDGKVSFKTPSVPGNAGFSGQMSADGSEIAGTWTQNAQGTPLVFKRLAADTTAP
jgi:hypothetical protein